MAWLSKSQPSTRFPDFHRCSGTGSWKHSVPAWPSTSMPSTQWLQRRVVLVTLRLQRSGLKQLGKLERRSHLGNLIVVPIFFPSLQLALIWCQICQKSLLGTRDENIVELINLNVPISSNFVTSSQMLVRVVPLSAPLLVSTNIWTFVILRCNRHYAGTCCWVNATSWQRLSMKHLWWGARSPRIHKRHQCCWKAGTTQGWHSHLDAVLLHIIFLHCMYDMCVQI